MADPNWKINNVYGIQSRPVIGHEIKPEEALNSHHDRDHDIQRALITNMKFWVKLLNFSFRVLVFCPARLQLRFVVMAM